MKSAAEHLATDLYSKLLSAKTEPFRVIKVKASTVTIGEDCIRNIVSVDRATGVWWTKKTPTEDHKTQTDDNNEEQKERQAEARKYGRRISKMCGENSL